MMSSLYLVPLFPLLGFLILVLGGGQLSKVSIAWIGVCSVGFSTLMSAIIGAEFLTNNQPFYRLSIGSWMTVADLTVSYGLFLDALSLTMLLVVTGVGFLIHVYSIEFMQDDIGYARFFAYMNLFVSAMLILVMADNLVLLFLGWEGVGLCSYLLIGFWFQEPVNDMAARKAFIMTRAGDAAMTIGLFLLFNELHTLDIPTLMLKVRQQWPVGTTLPMIAAMLLLGGAIGKSAQLPLQAWLPDAMAGPTPVSALIHAATMVTAGVYLIARTHELFILAPTVQFCIALIGTGTLILSGFSALTQVDIKRILAYSTISQIGYMFLALGVGAWSAAIFHLMTHAFFKALLFLAAGGVIHCLHHEHNIFKMGGLHKTLPFIFWTFLIGSAALAALPFTAGFYSKHAILLSAYTVSPGLWAIASFGALITGIYSFRLVFIVFFGTEQTTPNKAIGFRIRISLLILSLLSLVGGLLQIPLTSVFTAVPSAAEHAGFDIISVITIAAPLCGVLIAALIYLWGTLSASHWLLPLQRFWFNGWGFDELYHQLCVIPFTSLAISNKRDFVDLVYQWGARTIKTAHQFTSRSQTGKIRWYATSMGLGVVVIIVIGL
jgi:NADH-quinone oxidoreductase subunit L